MNSHFKHYDINRLLASVAKRLGKEVHSSCQKQWIYLGSDPTQGKLCAYDFEDGVKLFLLDGALPEDWEIVTKSQQESPFLLYSSLRGAVTFNYVGLEMPVELSPLKTLMAAHPPAKAQTVTIKKAINTTFAWLQLERSLYIHHIDCLPSAVRNDVAGIFSGNTAIKIFSNDDYALKCASLVQQILDDQKDGLIHATLVESKAIELFSLQLRRWEEEIVKTPATKSGQLRTADVENIIMARNLLVNNLKDAPTIEALSRKSGVNRQKLKQGFKKMFGTTINEYLRNERMRLAKQLLLAENPIVKEVATAVGYENQSYFARRFREKYGLYPNEYIRTIQAAGEEE